MKSESVTNLRKILARERETVLRNAGPAMDDVALTSMEKGNVFVCGQNSDTPLLIFNLLRHSFSILGVADDSIAGEKILRHRVLSSFELATEYSAKDFVLLSSCGHDRRAYTNFHKIAAYRKLPIVNHQQLAFFARKSGKPMNMTINSDYYVDSILNRADRYLSVLDLLDDELSRENLLRVLLGRLTINHDWFWSAYSPVENMYFPDFFHYGDNEILVDAGAFDGQDTLRFIRNRRYHFGQAWLFEIEPNNRQKIDKTLDSIDGTNMRNLIKVIPQGLWSAKDTLSFHGEGMTALLNCVQTQPISQTGKCEVVDLDSVVDNATLIKLEIEGAEMPALHGAKRLLKKCHPNLAISAYHLSDDIVNIVEFLRDLDLGYKFRIRHHWGTEIRTIIYAATDFRKA